VNIEQERQITNYDGVISSRGSEASHEGLRQDNPLVIDDTTKDCIDAELWVATLQTRADRNMSSVLLGRSESQKEKANKTRTVIDSCLKCDEFFRLGW
jgi:hypothetical protein